MSLDGLAERAAHDAAHLARERGRRSFERDTDVPDDGTVPVVASGRSPTRLGGAVPKIFFKASSMVAPVSTRSPYTTTTL